MEQKSELFFRYLDIHGQNIKSVKILGTLFQFQIW